MTTYQLDQDHSSISFSVKHMMISKVKGEFRDFTFDVSGEAHDLEHASAVVTIPVATIDTRSNDRDTHLKSADFFDVEQYPNITYRVTSFKKHSGDEYKVTGDLTIKDVTRTETFKVEYEGSGVDPWGNTRSGFEVDGKIKREDYNLTWNVALEAGGVLVGSDVKFQLHLEFIHA